MAYTGNLDTKLRRHGNGTYIYPSAGFKYTGNWERGIKQGHGTISFGGSTYTGHFENGEITGEGTKTFESGTVYTGEFEDGEFEGQGSMTTYLGENYVGTFSRNKRNGEGELTYTNGTIYQGTFSNNKKNGKGIEYYSNGSTFEGEWLNGKKHGQGTLTFVEGETLKATWNNGAINPEAQGGATFQDVKANYIYTGGWSSEKPTEAAKGDIQPNGSNLSRLEVEEGGEEEGEKEEKKNIAWIAELSCGDTVADWNFSIKTTKQIDKKNRIIPESGRIFTLSAWLVKPSEGEETAEPVVEEGKDGAEDGMNVEKEKFVPVPCCFFSVNEIPEDESEINGGDSEIINVVPYNESAPTSINMLVNANGIATLPISNVHQDVQPGTYELRINDSTPFCNGSNLLNFVKCNEAVVKINIGTGGASGGSKGGKKKKKTKK